MNKVELTPAKLADIKKKAEAAKDVKWPTIEQFPQHEEYPAAELIAAADPATVLAMVEEIERLRAGLKPACPHWQQDGDGINEWRRCCTNSSYHIPEGGEPSEFCPDCGGKVEVLDYDPNIESEATP